MRIAKIEDYRWLYENTDYMAKEPEKRFNYWHSILCDIIKNKIVLELGGGPYGAFEKYAKVCKVAEYTNIDPATNNEPKTLPGADVLVSFDVLEHIPYSQINILLVDFLPYKKQFHTIANMDDTIEVKGSPVDLHPIKEDIEWWQNKFKEMLKPRAIQVHRWIDERRFAIEVKI